MLAVFDMRGKMLFPAINRIVADGEGDAKGGDSGDYGRQLWACPQTSRFESIATDHFRTPR
jgi:hypothetical protein